jgi:hypothetical protein
MASASRFVSCVVAATAVVSSLAAAPPVVVLTDATAEAKIDFTSVNGAPAREKLWLTEAVGSGAAWLDYDGDGHLDLYLVNGSSHTTPAGEGQPNRLYRGDGSGTFRDVTAAAGVGDRRWGFGVAVGDIDNDGDPDLYVTNLLRNTLYRNDGDGSFSDVTAAAGVGDTGFGVSTAFFDMDNDGDLDLFVGNYVVFDKDKIPRKGAQRTTSPYCFFKGVYVVCGPNGLIPAQNVLYRNDGDGSFTDVTRKAGLWLEQPRYSLGVVTADYDNDGDQDIYVANDSVRNSLWRNDGKGNFEDVGLLTLSALNLDGKPQAGMGTNFGDFDGNGWLDLVVTNFSHDLNTIYRNLEGKFFMDESMVIGMGATTLALSWGPGFFDFDHDGDVDLFIANGHFYAEVDDTDSGSTYLQTNDLFINEGGRFNKGGTGSGLSIKRSFRGAAFADYDEDGDVDVLLTAMDDRALLLRNDTKHEGHRLQLRLVGSVSNRDAVGARVSVTSAGREQIREVTGGGSFASASSNMLHFGLGPATRADLIHVRWPSGKIDVLRDVEVDRVLAINEGSSPSTAQR